MPLESDRLVAGPRILIVEDEVLIAADLSRGLENMGYYPCGQASSGEEAVAKVRNLRPDLVLMDVYLTGKMDGIEAASRIKKTSRVPVVFVSGYADMELLDRAKSADPFGYVLKPIIIYEVRAAIEVALHRAAQEKSLALERRDQEFSPRGAIQKPISPGFSTPEQDASGLSLSRQDHLTVFQN